MYGEATSQEQESKGFFYPKETMGTTIVAIKYDGGVIACADTRTYLPTQAHPQAVSTLSTEWQTRSISSMTISSFSGVDLQGNPSKPPTRCVILSTRMSTSRADCLMLRLLLACSRS